MSQITKEDFAAFVAERTLPNFDIFFTANALVGEVGEVANVIKKEVFYERFDKYREKVDKRIEEGTAVPQREQFVDEGGDALFYLVQLFNKRGVTLDEVMAYQINKMNTATIENGDKVYKK